jgi:hypothetical protein
LRRDLENGSTFQTLQVCLRKELEESRARQKKKLNCDVSLSKSCHSRETLEQILLTGMVSFGQNGWTFVPYPTLSLDINWPGNSMTLVMVAFCIYKDLPAGDHLLTALTSCRGTWQSPIFFLKGRR